MSPDDVKLTAGDRVMLSARRVTPEDLEAIDTEFRRFAAEVGWEIEDEQGRHEGNDLSAVLENVIWDSVVGIGCWCTEGIKETLRASVQLDAILNKSSILVFWESRSGFKREAAERTYKKVVQRLQALPEARERNIYTTQATEKALRTEAERLRAEAERLRAEEANRWWRRARRAIPGWTLWFVTGIAASIIAGVILLLMFG